MWSTTCDTSSKSLHQVVWIKNGKNFPHAQRTVNKTLKVVLSTIIAVLGDRVTDFNEV